MGTGLLEEFISSILMTGLEIHGPGSLYVVISQKEQHTFYV